MVLLTFHFSIFIYHPALPQFHLSLPSPPVITYLEFSGLVKCIYRTQLLEETPVLDEKPVLRDVYRGIEEDHIEIDDILRT
jgi:hypothetical protein